MPDMCYLTIDQGGHATRAMLFDARGRVLEGCGVDVETRRSGTDQVEHDPEQIVESVHAAVADRKSVV